MPGPPGRNLGFYVIEIFDPALQSNILVKMLLLQAKFFDISSKIPIFSLLLSPQPQEQTSCCSIRAPLWLFQFSCPTPLRAPRSEVWTRLQLQSRLTTLLS